MRHRLPHLALLLLGVHAARAQQPTPGAVFTLEEVMIPKKFVTSIFDAKAADYVKATQRIYGSPGMASHILLPVVR